MSNSAEKQCRIEGNVAPGFESVRTLYEHNMRTLAEKNTQLCVYCDGEKVVDLWGSASGESDFSADSLVNVFSSGKSLESIAIASLVLMVVIPNFGFHQTVLINLVLAKLGALFQVVVHGLKGSILKASVVLVVGIVDRNLMLRGRRSHPFLLGILAFAILSCREGFGGGGGMCMFLIGGPSGRQKHIHIGVAPGRRCICTAATRWLLSFGVIADKFLQKLGCS